MHAGDKLGGGLTAAENGAEPAGSGALAAASGRRAGGGTIASRGQANRCAKFTLYFHICFEGENEGCKPKARALEIVQPCSVRALSHSGLSSNSPCPSVAV